MAACGEYGWSDGFCLIDPAFDLKIYLSIVFLLWIVTGLLFCLPLHINYLKVNYSTSIVVDDTAGTVQFITKSQELTYTVGTLKITRYLARYRDFRIPFSNYGYFRIECTDGNVFYATSLMMDPDKPTLPVQFTVYGFPAIPVL
jgi:hypothetical protein